MSYNNDSFFSIKLTVMNYQMRQYQKGTIQTKIQQIGLALILILMRIKANRSSLNC